MSDPRDEVPDRPEEHEMPRSRPWGPFSFFRTSLVVLAVVVAILLVAQFI